MIPIDIQVSRSKVKVKVKGQAYSSHLGKGGICFLQTAIFIFGSILKSNI